jgi:hypothetical protein
MTEQEISPAADRWATVSRGASNRARSARLRAPGADCPPDAAAPGSVRFGCLETTPQAVSVMLALHSHIRGGTEQHAVPLPERSRRRGHRVVFAGPADSWLADTLRQSDFPGYHVPLHGFCGVWSAIRLCRAAISFGADVRHGHPTLGAFYAGSVRKLTGRASVATAHWMNCHQRFA